MFDIILIPSEVPKFDLANATWSVAWAIVEYVGTCQSDHPFLEPSQRVAPFERCAFGGQGFFRE